MNTESKVVILEALAGGTIDAMKGARLVELDWHKVSDYLEELVRKGIAKYDRFAPMKDGLHQYVLNK